VTYPPPGAIGPRVIAWWSLRTHVATLSVKGLECIPRTGPVLLVARHYHHLLDGAVLIRAVPRPIHIVVALDWAANGVQRAVMERACAWAQWPVIVRPSLAHHGGAYGTHDATRYVRRGLMHAARLLAGGRVVVVFPEGRPAIDPAAPATDGLAGCARDGDGFLPFAGGFTTIARLAARRGAAGVRVVPVGFRYARCGSRWNVRARFGAPMPSDADAPDVERAVRALSA
jgi:1-acyl-sn-glycerol-3-phosphate acyltransferase